MSLKLFSLLAVALVSNCLNTIISHETIFSKEVDRFLHLVCKKEVLDSFSELIEIRLLDQTSFLNKDIRDCLNNTKSENLSLIKKDLIKEYLINRKSYTVAELEKDEHLTVLAYYSGACKEIVLDSTWIDRSTVAFYRKTFSNSEDTTSFSFHLDYRGNLFSFSPVELIFLHEFFHYLGYDHKEASSSVSIPFRRQRLSNVLKSEGNISASIRTPSFDSDPLLKISENDTNILSSVFLESTIVYIFDDFGAIKIK